MTASFVMPISFNPKYVTFAISPTHYTFDNLNEVKEFGLNICSEEMRKTAKICGSYSGREKDKFKIAKITPERSKIIKPPVVKECPMSLECKIEEMKRFGDHFLVVGKVVYEHVSKEDFKPLLHKTADIWPKIV